MSHLIALNERLPEAVAEPKFLIASPPAELMARLDLANQAETSSLPDFEELVALEEEAAETLAWLA